MFDHDRLQILTAQDAGQWRDTLDEIGAYDFFHLPEFHRLAESNGEGEAVLLAYREAGFTIAMPLLLRTIDLPIGVDVARPLRDATSVRGMAGPVASPGEIPQELVRRFQSRLQRFLKENHILTVYSRLNPVLDQARLLDGYGTTVDVGVTVSIDLTQPREVQCARYKRKRRREVSRLRETGHTCETVGLEYLDDFMRIYYETMDRRNADRAYRLDRSYFEYLLTEMSDVMHLFVCKLDGVVTSASICAECAGIVEMYLGGTASAYLPMSPAKLRYDTIREWGIQRGARVLHMGGSVGGRRDQVHEFKMGFGPDVNTYRTWRHVIDSRAYASLCRASGVRVGMKQDHSYFPAYRGQGLAAAHRLVTWSTDEDSETPIAGG